jgi:hypothetical protein
MDGLLHLLDPRQRRISPHDQLHFQVPDFASDILLTAQVAVFRVES